MNESGAMEGYVEFGHIRAERINLTDINEFTQTRQTYDPEAISELAESMRFTDARGERQFELINDLLVAKLDDEELASFIRDHEDFYDHQADISQMTRAEDGAWYVLISGHRRRRAIELNCRQDSIEFQNVLVACSVKPGITFEDALILQLRENVHLRPSVFDEAKAIERYYRLRSRRQGSALTIAGCARSLGFSESKVSEALRFARLPDVVQQEAASGMISYSHAVQLHGYMEVLNRYYPHKYRRAYNDQASNRTLEEDVTATVMTLVKQLKSKELEGYKSNQKTDIIKAHISNILVAMDYQDDGLFELEDEMTPVRQFQQAEHRLGLQALTIVLQRAQSSAGLGPKEQERMDVLRSLLNSRSNDVHQLSIISEPLIEIPQEQVA